VELLKRWRASPPPPVSVPHGVRVYAIGDIHGCAQLLAQLLEAIVEDSQGFAGAKRLVYLGDYVDRGPDSRAVIDRLLATPDDFVPTFLRGNHDQVLLDFLEDPAVFRNWREFGGRETLLSYGVPPPRFDNEAGFAEARDRFRQALPAAHLAFLSRLELSTRIGGYFFTHAGVRPGVPLDRQAPQDLLWIRDEFLSSRADFGMVVVHGHTPTSRASRSANRLSLDTGAYATGHLTAAVLEGDGCRFLFT
jgi:serine/threonine protein phosphatase 1